MEEEDLSKYKSMTDFFTRRVKKRVLEQDNEGNMMLSPADATVLTLGEVTED